MENYKEVITRTIKELGIPASVKCYHYARYAIELVVNDNALMVAITSKLYPKIAKEFNTTPASVERAIRHGIEIGWNRGNADFANKLFGYTVDANKGNPTNSEFLFTIADYISMEMKNNDR